MAGTGSVLPGRSGGGSAAGYRLQHGEVDHPVGLLSKLTADIEAAHTCGVEPAHMTTTAHAPSTRSTAPPTRAPAVEIVVPVHNELRDLATSIRRLHAYLVDSFPFTARIVIADNASSDGTLAAAEVLAAQLPGVRVVHIAQKGRGRAVAQVWAASDATVLVYMDVDLSTDLAALLPLVAPLLSGHSDIAIGSRLSRGARVVRGPRREVISRCYNALLHATLATRFSDAQCGFKAIRADRARQLLPMVADTGWFFDTELLVVAERSGLRIHEVPVDWVDDPDSRVDLVSTAVADLKGVARLARDFTRGALPVADLRAAVHAEGRSPAAPPGFVGQVSRFATIGAISTAAYVVLFLAARAVLPAQAANVLALVLTALANTAANRRFTFAVRGRAGVLHHQLGGLVVFALALLVTGAALGGLHAASAHPGRLAETAVLVAANLVATVLRFVLFRGWVFRAYRRPPVVPNPGSAS
ncbi:MAG: bifunctional glycosyltransferase family 2/GtrA family protein [Mycobacteriales bacterium]